MAIGTNDSIDKFAAQSRIDSTPATVIDGAFSIAGDVVQFTNTLDAPFGNWVLKLTAVGLSGIPSVGARVDLYSRLIDIEGTDDSGPPEADYEHIILGSFPVNNADADQNIPLSGLELPNLKTSQIHEFYIKNEMGVSTGTTWELYLTPTTLGPKA